MDRLFELLVSKIPKLDKTVNKSILKMKQTGHKYRLLTFGKDYVVVIRKSARAKSCVVEFFNIRGINRFRNILSIFKYTKPFRVKIDFMFAISYYLMIYVPTSGNVLNMP